MATEAQVHSAILEIVRRQLTGWFEAVSVELNERYTLDDRIEVPTNGTFFSVPFRALAESNDRSIGTLAPTRRSAEIEGVAVVPRTTNIGALPGDEEPLIETLANTVDIYTDTICILSQLGVQVAMKSAQMKGDRTVPGTAELAEALDGEAAARDT